MSLLSPLTLTLYCLRREVSTELSSPLAPLGEGRGEGEATIEQEQR